MLKVIYRNPRNTYFFFATLILVGIWSYLKLPVALFPNSTKPKIYVGASYGGMTREGFLNQFGKSLESDLNAIESDSCSTDFIEAQYRRERLWVDLSFSWGDDGKECLKEVSRVVVSHQSRWPEEIRRESYFGLQNQNTGFLFSSFYSDKRSSEEIYQILKFALQPKLATITEANSPKIYNPSKREIIIEVDPLQLASQGLLIKDVKQQVSEQIVSYGGGVINKGGKNVSLEVSSTVKEFDDLSKILISTPSGKKVFLSQIGEIRWSDEGKSSFNFKLNGEQSVILYVQPVPGKNIKIMSEKVIAAVKETIQSGAVPEDIKFSLIVNPAEFIETATQNVFQEVWLSSLIAVLVLFIFIGSFAGTLTALIEIPTSIILSFILLKIFGVQINLISLGGLALSVGMNVDASIVVIDNILKKFKSNSLESMGKKELVELIAGAVAEVRTPIIVSTITSLIVFTPLVFTSDLTYAILGDLAKAVIFSHGLSLAIALILVPTIRLHMVQKWGIVSEDHRIGWLDRALNFCYELYFTLLQWFLQQKLVKVILYLILMLSISAAIYWIPDQLKREIIGKPETAIIETYIESFESTSLDEMRDVIGRYERQLVDNIGQDIDVWWSNYWSNTNGFVAILLKNKKDYKKVFEKIEELNKGRSDGRFTVSPYNPAELPIPNPPDWKISFSGSTNDDIDQLTSYFRPYFKDSGVFENIQSSERTGTRENQLNFIPNQFLFKHLSEEGVRLSRSDVNDILSLSHDEMKLARIPFKDEIQQIYLRYPKDQIDSVMEVQALPLPLKGKVIPIKALGEFRFEHVRNDLVRENLQESHTFSGYFTEKEKALEKQKYKDFSALLQRFKDEELSLLPSGIDLKIVDAKVELSQAIEELSLTIFISLALIFMVLLIQFSSLVHTLIVMLAIPFGVLGVLVSLYLFQSSLSLNSVLGIILLNGITVANSIMLVEMIVRFVHSGDVPFDAIIKTVRNRIRPILMTSLTTILGMLPIALGLGEGGKVLQPLGIAVCGGLWVSLIFTLFVIPALELSYLNYKKIIK